MNNGNVDSPAIVANGRAFANFNALPNKPSLSAWTGFIDLLPSKNFAKELPCKPLRGPIPAKPKPPANNAALPIGDLTIFLIPRVAFLTSLPKKYPCLRSVIPPPA